MSHRRRHLGAFMRPLGIHTAWWRYPGGYLDANFNFRHLAHFAQRLESAKFDAFFMADHLAVMNMPMAALRRSAMPTAPWCWRTAAAYSRARRWNWGRGTT